MNPDQIRREIPDALWEDAEPVSDPTAYGPDAWTLTDSLTLLACGAITGAVWREIVGGLVALTRWVL